MFDLASRAHGLRVTDDDPYLTLTRTPIKISALRSNGKGLGGIIEFEVKK